MIWLYCCYLRNNCKTHVCSWLSNNVNSCWLWRANHSLPFLTIKSNWLNWACTKATTRGGGGVFETQRAIHSGRCSSGTERGSRGPAPATADLRRPGAGSRWHQAPSRRYPMMPIKSVCTTSCRPDKPTRCTAITSTHNTHIQATFKPV